MDFIVFMKMKNFCEDLVDGHACAGNGGDYWF
jgi:hypothetical protein